MKETKSIQSLKSLLFTSTVNKVLVGVILLCMVTNGFVPKSIESKESLFIVMTAVVSNAVVEVFNECRDTLTVISNNITKDLYKWLMLGEVGTDVPNNKEEEETPTPINTSSDAGIVVDRDDYEQIISFKLDSVSPILAVGKIQEDLYRLYGHIKECCSDVKNSIGIVFFVLFVLVITRRKEDQIVNETNLIGKEYKTNLC